MPTTPAAPPGWYRDPQAAWQYRWWDGTQWHGTPASYDEGLGRGFATLAWWLVGLIAADGVLSLLAAGLHTWGTVSLPSPHGLDTSGVPIAYDIVDGLLSLADVAVMVAAVVVWCVWQYRLARAAEPFVRRSPGMHVGSWFIPIVLLWFPFQNVKDLWNAHVRRPDGGLLAGWWTCWIVVNFLANVLLRSSIEGDPSMRVGAAGDLVVDVLSLPLAVLAVLVVLRLTRGAVEREASTRSGGGPR